MHLIKTYNEVDHHHDSLSYRISRMEEIYDLRNGAKDDPHRHDYFTLLLTRHARGKHIIDFREYPLAPMQVYFISPGQVHQVIEEEKSYGYVVLFSSRFLAENNIPVQFIEDLSLFRDHGETPPLEINQMEFEVLSGYCEEMLGIYRSDQQFKEQAISAYLKLFMIQCNNLCTLENDNPQNLEAGHMILRNFKKLVEDHHTHWHLASEYADALHVTPDHLNRVVRSLVGKTAKEYIQSKIVLSARRLLYFTELTAKEIGYQLGFTEPANFSAFFKKEAGVTPARFRKVS
ncbi:MAG: AraC family transcriptional regulator [Bacteroidales bacterium]